MAATGRAVGEGEAVAHRIKGVRLRLAVAVVHRVKAAQVVVAVLLSAVGRPGRVEGWENLMDADLMKSTSVRLAPHHRTPVYGNGSDSTADKSPPSTNNKAPRERNHVAENCLLGAAAISVA